MLKLEHLVSQWCPLRPDERAARLAALGPPCETLADLVGQAEDLVIGDLGRALEATALLIELSRGCREADVRAHVFRVRGQALTYANRFDEAMAALEEAVRLAHGAEHRLAAARANLALVHPLTRLGRYREALAAGRSAQSNFLTLGETAWSAKASVNIGAVHRAMNEPVAALAEFDRARPVLASNPVDLAQLDSNRAEALLELNAFAAAEDAFCSSLRAFEQAGANRACAIVEGNLADLMNRQGRLDRALYHYERARRSFEADHAAGDLSRVQAEQAEALAGAGLLTRAVQEYTAALSELDRHGLALEAARARTGLGRTLMRLGRFGDAESVLAEAARQFQRLGSRASRARVVLLQGELARLRSRRWRARRLLAEALEDLDDRPLDAAVAQHHLAALEIDDGDLKAAEDHLEVAIDTVRRFQVTPLLADLLHTRARVAAARGERRQALDDLRAAVGEIERIRGSLQADRLRAAFAMASTKLYEELVGALLEHDDGSPLEEAFATVERARCRALLDLATGFLEPEAVSVDDSSSGRLVERVFELRAELNALYSRVGNLGRAGGAEEIRRWKDHLERCDASLQAHEDRLATTRGIGGLFAAPAGAAEVQQLLKPRSALIEYFVMPREVVAFVLCRDSIRLFRNLCTQESLEDLVGRARFQIERALDRDPDDIGADSCLIRDAKRELAKVYEVIVGPLVSALEGTEHLTVVPHGPLHALPFHALHDGRRYLIEDFEITSSPSATLLRHLDPLPAAPADGGQPTSLVFGVPDGQAPLIEREIRAVADILPGARVFLGPDATCQRLRVDGEHAGIIHLACHGRFSPASPLASGLKLGDRWLTVRDLYGMKLRGPLVVLSGCDTARAAVSNGDELVGLMRGFFAAGASALLMTLWPLHDDSAADAVAQTYDLWQNGALGKEQGLAAAVRQAQRQTMQARPHPLYWAPFTLVGRP